MTTENMIKILLWLVEYPPSITKVLWFRNKSAAIAADFVCGYLITSMVSSIILLLTIGNKVCC